jgi:hypothetical protein
VAVSHAERTRCPGCGAFIRRRAELDDELEQERAYAGDEFEDLHQCPALEAYGPRRQDVTRARRRERPRTTASKQRGRLRKHVCACQPPRILRAACRDLTDLECPRCSSYFVYSPTPSELSDDELSGRVPA